MIVIEIETLKKKLSSLNKKGNKPTKMTKGSRYTFVLRLILFLSLQINNRFDAGKYDIHISNVCKKILMACFTFAAIVMGSNLTFSISLLADLRIQ